MTAVGGRIASACSLRSALPSVMAAPLTAAALLWPPLCAASAPGAAAEVACTANASDRAISTAAARSVVADASNSANRSAGTPSYWTFSQARELLSTSMSAFSFIGTKSIAPSSTEKSEPFTKQDGNSAVESPGLLMPVPFVDKSRTRSLPPIACNKRSSTWTPETPRYARTTSHSCARPIRIAVFLPADSTNCCGARNLSATSDMVTAKPPAAGAPSSALSSGPASSVISPTSVASPGLATAMALSLMAPASPPPSAAAPGLQTAAPSPLANPLSRIPEATASSSPTSPLTWPPLEPPLPQLSPTSPALLLPIAMASLALTAVAAGTAAAASPTAAASAAVSPTTASLTSATSSATTLS
mmetsp:Transcript_26743/g.74702  ORF Transcript_26743/g.74702 Transcript_26743/m.74702 type:complete len:360 (-) Transcript_26743:230-1309(-)